MLDEIEVDNHILSAMGSDYFVSGSQLAGERKGRGHEGGRR